MTEWIPVLQSLVWPLFLAALLFFGRSMVARLIKAIEERILAGAEFEAGTGGIKIGPAPKLSEAPSTSLPQSTPKAVAQPLNAPQPNTYYLVHTSRRDRSRDNTQNQYYKVRIYLDADEACQLDDVAEVTYYFHETFHSPLRVVRDRSSSFEVIVSIWGEFNVAATVKLRDGKTLHLERYLNL